MINTSAWKEFCVGDLFPFQKVNKFSKKPASEGSIEFVTSSSYNNGVSYYCDEDTIAGNCITVSTNGKCFDCFYHKNDLAVSTDVEVLYSPFLNEYNGLFICSVLQQEQKKYDFKDKPKNGKVFDTLIRLPAAMDGRPDWDYMESYMKAVMKTSKKSLGDFKKVDDTKQLIDISEWGKFKVGDLFDKLTLRRRKANFNKAIDCSEVQTEEFSLPLTNAKHFNNGIQFYGRPDEWDSAEMTIDIVSNGAIATGDVYAQPQKTGVLWDSYLVKCRYNIKSELVLQYMACVIQRCIKQYFGWDDKCTWDKVKEQVIRLPIDANNEPDWQYMENYMRKQFKEAESTISKLQLAV